MTAQTAQIAQFRSPAYHEALDLLSEAHTYISYRQALDESKLDPKQRLLMSYETMRLTARLTQIMAWLMAQRAVQQGEMTREDMGFDKETEISAELLSLDDREAEESFLPRGLRYLMEKSHNLYVRILRLEKQFKTVH
jgi:regulator of CtrA degradation